MVAYVFDTSAILRFLDSEAGSGFVDMLLAESFEKQNLLLISAINWGELAGKLYKRSGTHSASETLLVLQRRGLQVINATPERAVRAALVSARIRVSYADAFGIELASAPDHILVTADYGAKPAASEVSIQFLPLKPPA